MRTLEQIQSMDILYMCSAIILVLMVLVIAAIIADHFKIDRDG